MSFYVKHTNITQSNDNDWNNDFWLLCVGYSKYYDILSLNLQGLIIIWIDLSRFISHVCERESRTM